MFAAASNIRKCGSRDEPPMTACGGNLIGGEIKRNEQCPLCGLATIELADAHRPGGGPQRPENMPFGMFSARGRNARKTIQCLIAFGSWFSVEAGRQPW